LTAASLQVAAADRPRLAVIDLIRGGAVVAMVVYHLSWDLLDYGLIDVDVVNDPLWRGFAHAIAGTFLALVGFNLVLANRNGVRPGPYLRRLGIIAGGAALVSLGTYWFMPEAFVFFGILHMIVVASLLALPFLRVPVALTVAAAVFSFAAPSLMTSAAFDAKPFLWLGLSAHPVATVDYVPVFPWFGLVLGGIAAARLTLDRGGAGLLARWQPAAGAWRPILFAGRWSLPIYLIHQPVMVGIISLVMPFFAESDDALAGRFLDRCKASCQDAATSAKQCEATCGCVLTGAAGAGLLRHAMAGRMNDAEDHSWQAVVEQCLPKPPAPPVTGG
jgi:uncharacterized membrane protein